MEVMKTPVSNKVLWWVIAVLAVLNISTLATIGFHMSRSERELPLACQTMGDTTFQRPAMYNGRFFRDILELNADQMDKFREINRPFRQETRQLTVDLSDLRNSMMNEMAKLNPDTFKLNQLSIQIGEKHARLKIITYQYFLNIKAICNEGQQKKLEQVVRTIFQSDAKMGTPGGQGMHRGMGKGQGKGMMKDE
jgi:hypothetical protein